MSGPCCERCTSEMRAAGGLNPCSTLELLQSAPACSIKRLVHSTMLRNIMFVEVQESDILPMHVLCQEVQRRGLSPEAHQQQARRGDVGVQGHRTQQGELDSFCSGFPERAASERSPYPRYKPVRDMPRGTGSGGLQSEDTNLHEKQQDMCHDIWCPSWLLVHVSELL